MRAAIHDGQVLETVSPVEITTYLKARGWTLQMQRNDWGSVWTHLANSREYDLLVPMTRRFADYALRVGEVLETLSSAEERSQLEVIRDVQASTSDLLRLRATNTEAEGGTLPLDLAVSFVERSRDMMLAAACAAIDKRAVFARRKPDQAMGYLSHLRLGQTEHGSYVLTILSTIPPELRHTQATFLEEEPPYERRVTQTLMYSLAALSDAAKSAAITGVMEPFRSGIAIGISANLCDAIVGLASVSPGQPLDLSMTWAANRQSPMIVPERVTFDSESIPVIEEAARQFRATEPLEDVEIEGLVTRLDRGPTASEGELIVAGSIDGQLLRIGLTLKSDVYSSAVRAHDERQTVRCTGELVKEGRGFKLVNPRHFVVVASE